MVHRPACLLLLAALAGAPLPSAAQLATLENDLNVLAGGGTGSAPFDFRVIGERLLFTAESAASGREMWASDGTAGGTELLADACPGECSPYSAATPVAAGGGLLYFVAPTAPQFAGFFDLQLWRTDGTREGTFPLFEPATEVAYGSLLRGRSDPAFAGPRLLFVASTPELGAELWASDGSREATGPVADLTPGPEGSEPNQLTALGSEVFFFTRPVFAPPGAGAELWASDGTAVGTRRVTEVFDPDPDLLTAAGERLFFATAGRSRLWVSDGTSGGTGPVAEPPSRPLHTFSLAPWRDGVAYAARDEAHGVELWASDGSGADTRRLTDFTFAEPFDGRLLGHHLAAVGDRLVVFAREAETGREPWVTDGTPEGTRLLADLCPGSCSSIEFESHLTVAGEAVFFTARDGEGRIQLWRSDGTPEGTFRVSRRCDRCAATPGVTVLAGTVYFVAAGDDGDPELWSVEASGVGPRRLTRFPSADPFPGGGSPGALPWIARLGDRLLFAADDGVHGRELWVHPAGGGPTAALVADLAADDPASAPQELVAFGDGVAYSAFDGRSFGVWTSRGDGAGALAATPADPDHPCAAYRPTGLATAGSLVFMVCGLDLVTQDLYRTDGSPAGTARLTDLAGRPDASVEAALRTVAGGELFFAVTVDGRPEVWRSDGTPGGTGRAFGFDPDLADWISTLTEVDGTFYVLTGTTAAGSRLWRSGGTDASTELLADLGPYRFGPGSPFLSLGDAVLFPLFVGTGPGGELWATDGTPAGTAPLAGYSSLAPKGLIRLGDRLYFVAAPGAQAFLWESDGTAAGTLPVRALGPVEAAGYFDPELTRVGDRLFFVAEDLAHGRELWTSDGTAAGTGPARDIAPGPGSSFPHGLTAARDELLLFAAGDGVHGVEPWASDAQALEVRMVHDLAPGPASSSPREPAAAFTPGGDRLFFSADDGLYGRELWSLPLHPRLRGCIVSETAVCLGARFRAEVAWRDSRGRARPAPGVRLTRDAGVFTFARPESPQIAAKILDGTALNGHRWVFYGALTNRQYALTVTDAETGLARRYGNPPGRFAADGDILAFGPRGASLSGSPPPQEAAPAPSAAVTASRTAADGACAPSETRLCLRGDRFAVEVLWRDFGGRTGAGHAEPLAGGDAGAFWFFRPDNVELVLEILDGSAVNGRFWVFYGALTNVEYQVTVTDTATGDVRTYFNTEGTFASVGDTGAF